MTLTAGISQSDPLKYSSTRGRPGTDGATAATEPQLWAAGLRRRSGPARTSRSRSWKSKFYSCFFAHSIPTYLPTQALFDPYQCDQIWRFIGLWGIFYSLWQQSICPNLPHS